ncbi:MAG: type II toxin-antitoxin system RelE/ParE family toxin [Rhodospirillaceae bacterium]
MAKALVTVVETRHFVRACKGRLADRQREDVIDAVATDPEIGDLLEGTGGVRKLRVAARGKGKSGGARVVYYYYNDTIPVFMLTVFGKNEKDNLTKSERNDLAKLVKSLRDAYGE